MADETTPGTPPAGTAPTSSQPAGNEPANPSHRDWNALAMNMRQVNEGVSSLAKILADLPGKLVAPAATSAPKPDKVEATAPNAPADAGLVDRMAKLERQLAIKSAIADLSLTGEARATFEEMAGLVQSDQIQAIAEKIAKLHKATPAASAAGDSAAQKPPETTAPSVKPGSSNTGAGAPGAAPIIPDRIEDIPKDVLRTMSLPELREKYEKQKAAAGMGNPFAQARNGLQKK